MPRIVTDPVGFPSLIVESWLTFYSFNSLGTEFHAMETRDFQVEDEMEQLPDPAKVKQPPI